MFIPLPDILPCVWVDLCLIFSPTYLLQIFSQMLKNICHILTSNIFCDLSCFTSTFFREPSIFLLLPSLFSIKTHAPNAVQQPASAPLLGQHRVVPFLGTHPYILRSTWMTLMTLFYPRTCLTVWNVIEFWGENNFPSDFWRHCLFLFLWCSRCAVIQILFMRPYFVGFFLFFSSREALRIFPTSGVVGYYGDGLSRPVVLEICVPRFWEIFLYYFSWFFYPYFVFLWSLFIISILVMWVW